MQIPIGQWLDNASDYLSTQISWFIKWYESNSGIKTRKFLAAVMKMFFIASVYYVIYLLCKFIYSLAPTPEDGYKAILAVCGIIAFIWALVRIIIVVGKLLQKFRIFKREKIDIPLRIWSRDAFANLKQTKLAIAYWESLKYLTRLSELVTNKFFIWTLHSILEPELDSHSQEEFFSVENLPEKLKEMYGETVGKRYANFGLALGMFWAMFLFFITVYISSWILNPVNSLFMYVSGLFGEVFQSIVNFIFTTFEMVFIFSVLGTSFVGVLIAINKRASLWWTPSVEPVIQEPQQQEYQELKEHLAHKMDELVTATEQVNSIDKQLIQRKQALEKLRQLEPELAGQVGILVNMVLEEGNAKTEISERKKAKTDLLKDIVIGALFFFLGLIITSDVIKSFLDKIMTILKSLGS